MTNEELKKKIVEILNEAFTERDVIPVHTAPDGNKTALPDELCKIFNNIVVQAVIPYFADALIAAGIGDVKTAQEIGASATAMAVLEAAKAEHRAEVAERALESACENVKELVSFLIKLSEIVDGLRVECCLPEESEPKAYINRAEKELAEEGKGG